MLIRPAKYISIKEVISMKKLYVGLDVHKKFCQAVVIDIITESGDVIKREKRKDKNMYG